MSKITFVVIAVLVFIASVCGTDKEKDELKLKVAKELEPLVDALTDVKEKNVREKLSELERQLKDAKDKSEDEKKMITKVIGLLKAAALGQTDELNNEKLKAEMKKIVKSAEEKAAKTSGVSKSVPSMIAAVVVTVGIFMN